MTFFLNKKNTLVFLLIMHREKRVRVFRCLEDTWKDFWNNKTEVNVVKFLLSFSKITRNLFFRATHFELCDIIIVHDMHEHAGVCVSVFVFPVLFAVHLQKTSAFYLQRGQKRPIYGSFAQYIQCNLIHCQEPVKKFNGGIEQKELAIREGD